MSTVSAGTENGGMNSPPSKPSKKHKPFRPKKKNKYGRTQKGRNNKSLIPLQGTPTAHRQSPLLQNRTPIQSSRPSHGSTPLNELSPKQLLRKAKDLHKLKESQMERITHAHFSLPSSLMACRQLWRPRRVWFRSSGYAKKF